MEEMAETMKNLDETLVKKASIRKISLKVYVFFFQ